MSSYSTEWLEKRLTAFAGTTVFMHAGTLQELESPYPEERQLVDRAIRSRQFEFYTGRNFARQALKKHGLPPEPILRGPLGNPVWPGGVIGSITHDKHFALAAIALSPPLTGFGIDLLENTDDVTAEMAPLILHRHESELLAGLFPHYPPAAVAFSVKEAVVKAVSPRLNTYLDMLGIELKDNKGELIAQLSDESLSCPCLVTPSDFGLLSASFC